MPELWTLAVIGMSALPPLPKQFTAEIVRSDDNERTKVYVDGWMRRIEVYSKTGQCTVFINRPDKGVLWTLSPETKTYSQCKGGWESLLDPDSLYDWCEDGTEMIDGSRCRRFVGRSTGDAREVCFVDAQTQMRRRAVTYNLKGEHALTVDYLNAVVGPPPRAVFDLPEGYKRGYNRRRK